METALNPIQKCDEAIALVESGEATREQVMLALGFKKELGAKVRDFNQRFEKAAIQWIKKNGDIQDGVHRFYVGKETKRKCKNVKEAVNAFLEMGGPDVLVLALSSDCFKHATAMKMLGDNAKTHFDEKTDDSLETGKPKEKLRCTAPGELTDGRESDE